MAQQGHALLCQYMPIPATVSINGSSTSLLVRAASYNTCAPATSVDDLPSRPPFPKKGETTGQYMSNTGSAQLWKPVGRCQVPTALRQLARWDLRMDRITCSSCVDACEGFVWPWTLELLNMVTGADVDLRTCNRVRFGVET